MTAKMQQVLAYLQSATLRGTPGRDLRTTFGRGVTVTLDALCRRNLVVAHYEQCEWWYAVALD